MSLEEIIAIRVRESRQDKQITLAGLAARTGMSKAMISKIENAQTSCSLSTLAKLAEALGVPVTALFRGVDAEREAVFVPAGHGAQIVRRGSNIGHLYEQLGSLRGEHKRIEPLLVTLTEASEVFPLFQHSGTEFLYMLQGVMVYGHGNTRAVAAARLDPVAVRDPDQMGAVVPAPGRYCGVRPRHHTHRNGAQHRRPPQHR